MAKTLEEEINFYIRKNKLSFSPYLEKLFYEDYFDKSITTIRIALILSFILYSSFGVLDIYIAPLTKKFIWIIRYAIVCPLVTLVFISSFFSFFKKIMRPVICFISIALGFGIIAMIATSVDINTGLFYYAGLILVLMWIYTFVRLPFILATIVGWIIVIGYEISAIFFQGMLESSDLTTFFINNNFFFISANIIGMFVSYFLESYARKDFLQRLIIVEKQKDIENEKNRLKDRNEVMEMDLNMARSIQQELIPGKNPNDKIASLFKPMEPVGGDFYDFIRFREPDKIGIFISDVSGHGVPAAFITSMIKSIISQAGRFKEDPAELLLHLNDILADKTAGNFVTAFYAIYNMKTRLIKYANAGHNYPYVVTDNSIERLSQGASMPLAILENEYLDTPEKRYKDIEETIPENCKIVFYTDGLIEAAIDNDPHKQFETVIDKKLLELKPQNCENFITNLYQELVDFAQTESFEDDICIICIDVD
ncbi:MAG: serine/threonine-protein phosphatase [bacterium]|nr:serine/threonine-protein phosphatase [bacterium]